MIINKRNIHVELSKLETGLANTEHLFATANFSEGNESLKQLFMDISAFLYNYFPSKIDEFTKISKIKGVIKRTGSLSGLVIFRDQIGNSLLVFIRKIKEEVNIMEDNNVHTPDDKKQKVFIIHGRNIKAYDVMHTFLLELGLHPIDFFEARKLTKKPSPTIPEILDVAFSHAQAMIVLMTPDDLGSLRKEYLKKDDSEDEKNPTPQCRQNVIFEAGMAIAIDPNRVIFAELGRVRKFTDLNVHIVKLSNLPGCRQDLALRLQDAGCIISNNSGSSRWLDVGDFEATLV